MCLCNKVLYVQQSFYKNHWDFDHSETQLDSQAHWADTVTIVVTNATNIVALATEASLAVTHLESNASAKK